MMKVRITAVAATMLLVTCAIAQAEAEPPFDPATLPPIDGITAASDVSAFLREGVPAELTRAALRRAWTADPAIRDFVGLAENAWDFTDPNAMPGFGPLEPTGAVRRASADSADKTAQAEALAARLSAGNGASFSAFRQRTRVRLLQALHD
jgi:hypothetical protein